METTNRNSGNERSVLDALAGPQGRSEQFDDIGRNGPKEAPGHMTRRALLTRAGAAGIALAAYGMAGAGVFAGSAAGAGDRGQSVGQSVYGTGGDPDCAACCATPVWYNVKEEGAAGDGTTDDAAALAALTAAIGTSAKAVVYFPGGAYRLGSNVSFGSNVALIMDQGAVLTPDAAVVVTIAGTLQAGLYRIFAGDGTIAGPIRVEALYPQWWGAKADGANDDTAAINSAIRCANGAGGGKVFLPAGTYRLSSPQGSNNALIVPMSGVDIEGEGDCSVLKPADGLNAGRKYGWNVIFPPESTAAYTVNNASFRRFKVDGNGVNNLEESTKSHKNAAIGVLYGSNLTVDSVTVVQNAGRQCFTFGRNSKPHTVKNLIVQNCYVDTVGQAVAGNVLQNDHSVIYASADICSILNNRFTNPAGGQGGSTAFEIHSSNVIMTSNICINFSTAINIVATVTDQVNSLYAHNVFTGVHNGIAFYCSAGMVMDQITVHANLFETIGTVYPVLNLDSNVKAAVKSVVLTDNTIRCVSDDLTQRMSGVRVGRVERTEIRGNRFYRLVGRAVELGTILDDGIVLAIEGNDIVDCCRTTNASYKKAIDLNSLLQINVL
ncbi:MAG: hypothetical protein K0Q59_5632, partial [Paenibacillus sp.]|nr:hypothetical protein [Paenibacillus sp.]